MRKVIRKANGKKSREKWKKEVNIMKRTILTGIIALSMALFGLTAAYGSNVWDSFISAVDGVMQETISMVWNYQGGARVSIADRTTGTITRFSNGNVSSVDALKPDIDAINDALGLEGDSRYGDINAFLADEVLADDGDIIIIDDAGDDGDADGNELRYLSIAQKMAIIAENTAITKTVYVYENGQLVSTRTPVVDEDGVVVNGSFNEVTYNDNGQRSAINTWIKNEETGIWEEVKFEFEYDDNGAFLTGGYGTFSLVGAMGGVSGVTVGYVEFDVQNRIAAVYDADNAEEASAIDPVVRYTYDQYGNLRTLEALRDGVVVGMTTNAYAGGQRVQSTTIAIFADGTTETSASIKYTYDEKGMLLYSTDSTTLAVNEENRVDGIGTDPAGVAHTGGQWHNEWDNVTSISKTYYLFGGEIFTNRETLSSEHIISSTQSPPPPPHNDPVVSGTLTGVQQNNGKFYLVLDAAQIDLLDGNGLQAVEGETFLIGVDEQTARGLLEDDKIGEQIVVMGDIASNVNGYRSINMNPEYGGGIVTAEVGQTLDTYTQKSWYQRNLALMSKKWAEVKAEYGKHTIWRQGWEFLKSLLGL